MSTLGSSGRVGVTVVIAGVLLGGMYVFFQGLSNTYPIHVLYPDASGTVTGMPVDMAGVKIGEVDDISLRSDRQADVRLKIFNNDKIPIGSKFRIAMPLLGGVGSIAVIPPAGADTGAGNIQSGDVVNGQPSFDLAGTIGKSSELLASLTRTTNKAELVVDDLQSIMGDPRLKQGLIGSVQNISLASENGLKLTQHLDSVLSEDNNDLVALLTDTRTSAKKSMSNIADTTEQFKDMTASDRSKVDEILSNLQDTTAAVAGITTATNDSLKNGKVTQNIAAIVANLKSSTDHLNQIAADLQKISGDPTTNSDLKSTIHNIKETTEQSAYLMARLNKLAGNKNAPPLNLADSTQSQSQSVTVNVDSGKQPDKKSSSSIEISPRVDFLQNTAQDHFRADANAIVGLGGPAHNFGEVGVYGLGDTNHFNLQYGQGYGSESGLDYRAGLYDSKLGVGADYDLAKNFSFSLNIYNPNHYMVDAQSVVMLNKNLGLVLGVDDITRQAGGSIGIELRH